MRRRKLYEVLDLDYNKVFEGNASQCADFINCDESHIRDCKEQRVVMRQYRIRRTDRLEPAQEKKKPEPEIDYSTNPYECMKWHLRVYGDTFVTFNPEPYFPRLKEEGFDCTYRAVRDYIDNPRPKKRGRKPKPKYFYVVEVVKNADRRSESVQE